jgi:hypothetical protein
MATKFAFGYTYKREFFPFDFLLKGGNTFWQGFMGREST